MPVWDGWQFMDEFMKLNINQLNICILTSSNDEEDIKKVENYNFINNYLVKPIGLDQLKEILEKIVYN